MSGIVYPEIRRDETHFDDFHGTKVRLHMTTEIFFPFCKQTNLHKIRTYFGPLNATPDYSDDRYLPHGQ